LGVSNRFLRNVSAEYIDHILKGTKPVRSSGASADQSRAADQSQNRQSAWINDSATLLALADEVRTPKLSASFYREIASRNRLV
jgi:hypothetical protein